MCVGPIVRGWLYGKHITYRTSQTFLLLVSFFLLLFNTAKETSGYCMALYKITLVKKAFSDSFHMA